jgi:1-phosphatidylinositol-3-phosphate 5-kinase
VIIQNSQSNSPDIATPSYPTSFTDMDDYTQLNDNRYRSNSANVRREVPSRDITILHKRSASNSIIRPRREDNQSIRPSNATKIDNRLNLQRPIWIPDSSAKGCLSCMEQFTLFNRRHHCRLCGQIFCSKCCQKISCSELRAMGYTDREFVCNICRRQDTDSEVTRETATSDSDESYENSSFTTKKPGLLSQ